MNLLGFYDNTRFRQTYRAHYKSSLFCSKRTHCSSMGCSPSNVQGLELVKTSEHACASNAAQNVRSSALHQRHEPLLKLNFTFFDGNWTSLFFIQQRALNFSTGSELHFFTKGLHFLPSWGLGQSSPLTPCTWHCRQRSSSSSSSQCLQKVVSNF